MHLTGCGAQNAQQAELSFALAQRQAGGADDDEDHHRDDRAPERTSQRDEPDAAAGRLRSLRQAPVRAGDDARGDVGQLLGERRLDASGDLGRRRTVGEEHGDRVHLLTVPGVGSGLLVAGEGSGCRARGTVHQAAEDPHRPCTADDGVHLSSDRGPRRQAAVQDDLRSTMGSAALQVTARGGG
ncbi:hypothetical protein [Kineococcus sp. SYSU DK003]|uniref:hypothetical protein n=1 Tax=Kineococcus sp. SYSU DK003 TaxID=3383124 RepID=UPI003D7C5937